MHGGKVPDERGQTRTQKPTRLDQHTKPTTGTSELIRASDTLGLVLELVDELVDAGDHDARLALGRLLYAHLG